ncbi:hypothetical protein EV426DRAFT_618900 [Tirmania nivea]|nr:hypothetical protein EV426DRAFT_618900 [Tirmania nivea]
MSTPSPQLHPKPIIHINGWPGVGKLTVARFLTQLLGGPDHCRLIHNHLLIDPAGALLPRTSPTYQSLRQAFRKVTFDCLSLCPETFNHTYVFTDFTSSDALGSSVASEYAEAARSRKCVFVPIILECNPEENARRIRGANRDSEGHGKLTDTTILLEMKARSALYRFENDANQLELDVSNLEPLQAAEVILRHIIRVTEVQTPTNNRVVLDGLDLTDIS